MSRLTQKQDNLYYPTNENSIFPDDGSNAIRLLQVIGEYEDLEEELGIDLLTLFKALKDGIWISLDNVFFNTLIYKLSSDLSLKFYLGKWYIAYYHSLNGKTFYVGLKDFNKTWWLEKPKENDDD